MNERIIEIGLESGMLNYVDNETPRHYFLSGHADEQDLAKFAELIVRECLKQIKDGMVDESELLYEHEETTECVNEALMDAHHNIAIHFGFAEHFGVEE